MSNTDILSSVLSIDVDIVQDIHLELIEYEESEICELMIDLSNLAVSQEIKAYKNQLENKQDDLDNSDEEPPKISAFKRLNKLKNFILFAKQQMCDDFFLNDNNLKVFCKYLLLIKRKIAEFMKQKPIIDFFRSANQSIMINDRFFLNDLEFSNDNDSISDNDYFFNDNDFSNNNHFSGDNNFLDDDYFFDDNYFSDYEGFSNNYHSSPNDIITN
ncbi:7965_t:CDS:2 [Cetraspora pellucida]|uniref:7965_t:CDS:1 n=1 Tax=Cetraspora pellucida TaxID=1433469 RepID=A0ACA9LPN7_9GLOM|nr:7965_t:CDS:2 [Cetraspora pellucida]